MSEGYECSMEESGQRRVSSKEGWKEAARNVVSECGITEPREKQTETEGQSDESSVRRTIDSGSLDSAT